MEYYVYILKCSDGSFYTGIAQDLKNRLRQHNGEVKGGAVYTRSKRPVKLVHFEEYESRKDAAKREHEIKRMDRAKKASLVKSS